MINVYKTLVKWYWQGKLKYSEENLSLFTFVHHKSYMAVLELIMGPLSDRLRPTAGAMIWPFNNNFRWKRISDKVNKIEPCESTCSASIMILALQWPPGVIPVLPHSDQVWHDAGDTQHWLLAWRDTVPGANELPLWQVGRHLWACNGRSVHSKPWH
jgi:hypothetical protein